MRRGRDGGGEGIVARPARNLRSSRRPQLICNSARSRTAAQHEYARSLRSPIPKLDKRTNESGAIRVVAGERAVCFATNDVDRVDVLGLGTQRIEQRHD